MGNAISSSSPSQQQLLGGGGDSLQLASPFLAVSSSTASTEGGHSGSRMQPLLSQPTGTVPPPSTTASSSAHMNCLGSFSRRTPSAVALSSSSGASNSPPSSDHSNAQVAGEGGGVEVPVKLALTHSMWGNPNDYLSGSPKKKTRAGKCASCAAHRVFKHASAVYAASWPVRTAVRIAVFLLALCVVSRLFCAGFEILPAESGICAALPVWVTGLSWLPANDEAAVLKPSGAVFDRFHATYHCTPLASAKTHRPKLLFAPPKLAPTLPPLKDQKGQLDMFIGILSGCKSRQLRDAVRETWLRIDTVGLGTWKAVFIVGNCKEELKEEQVEFGDLLFTSVEESYYALTGKVLEFFEHAAMVDAKFTMKTDDDTFVFVDRMLSELQGMQPKCLYWGSSFQGLLPSYKTTFDNTKHMHVLSVPTVKWYIPAKDYTPISEVPYMAGGGYILSADLVQKVVAAKDGVPYHLPEDATMAALVGKKLSQACSCKDARHIKDVDSFQNLRLMSPDGLQADAEPCDVSNVVYRTLSIHGIRSPLLHHTILDTAIAPLQSCNATHTRGSGIRYAGKVSNAIWARKLKVRGPTIYMQALAYSDMVNTSPNKTSQYCKRCTVDRVVPYKTSLNVMNELALERTPYGFRKAYLEMKENGTLPDARALVPLTTLFREAEALPLCSRLTWAKEITEMLVDLSEQRLLLCDLSPERTYINTTTGSVVISAGKSQWLYSASRRYHSDAWCFSDVQCEACFKTSHEQPMGWLPEAQCSSETKQCIGFDGSSQAAAAITKLLMPLLSSDQKMAALMTSLLKANPSGRMGVSDGLVYDLDAALKELKAGMECTPKDWNTIVRILTKASRTNKSVFRKLFST